jgi:leader peptidase (prepilin peptidase)/N-methyltransferase
MVTGDPAAILAGCAAAIAAAPYLAGLTLSAPDRDLTRWWRPRAASAARIASVASCAVVLTALGARATGWSAAWPAFQLLGLLGSALLIIDLECHRLPNRLMLPLAGGLAALALAAAAGAQWDRLARILLAAAGTFALLYLVAFASARSIGFGDVKLTAVLAGHLAWFGWPSVIAGIACGFLLGGAAAIALLAAGRATRRTHLPLGPCLVLGALLAAAIA